MERYYGVRGRQRVDAIAAAIVDSGGEILKAPSPSVAPFEFDVRLPDGKYVTLICYAFTANKYKQQGRPAGEHRLQVKYGSDFKRLHNVFIDPRREKITLFFGVHEDHDVFVAADPALHNPTWFSSSIEFKERDVRKALRLGWHGWERERVQQGRRRVLPQESLTTEALLAFTPKHFLTYALFERVATGIETGERLLLINDIADDLRGGGTARQLIDARRDLVPRTSAEHRLLTQFALPIDEILDLIAERPRLFAAVRGGVAEHHLEQLLKKMRGVGRVERIKTDEAGDFQIEYRRRPLMIECKNVRSTRLRGLPFVDFQKTRAAKGNPCSRYYSPEQFEVLAACIFPVTGSWDFRFSLTEALPEHGKCRGKIAERIVVDDSWPGDLPSLLG